MRHYFRFLRYRSGAVGLAIVLAIVAVALFGPWVAPHGQADTIAAPGAKPGDGLWLGADLLGRDVVSRILWGGRSVLILAVAATFVAYLFGIPLGLAAGYSKSLVDPAIMRSIDVLRAFPPLLFFLIFIAAAGNSILVLILAVAAPQVIAITRIVYSATLGASVRGYVEAAEARGERPVAVIRREIFPNIFGLLLGDVGLRLCLSILLLAAVNFLGLGLQPPRSDWGLMISENREIIGLNVWALAAPAIILGLLTVGLNLVGDAISRSLGHSGVGSPRRGLRTLGRRPPVVAEVVTEQSAILPTPVVDIDQPAAAAEVVARPRATRPDALFELDDLTVRLDSGEPVVEHISFGLKAGETIGIVGESGSGKTTVALALLGYARSGMTIAGGTVRIGGERVQLFDKGKARSMRGRLVSYVPQDPTTSLNPSLRIGGIVGDMLREHATADTDRDIGRALERVHLPGDPAFERRYPHQLSGGQQQRVAIATALATEPPVVVLDEPTTGLDVVTQTRILDEINRLKRERSIAMVYISHDLAVVSQVADRIAVMYAGSVVEEGPTEEILQRPYHPYTRGLVASIPDHVDPHRLRGMPGSAVGTLDRPPGCPFAARCPQRIARCSVMPPLEPIGADREVACWAWKTTPPLDSHEPLIARERRHATPLLVVERLDAVHRDRRGNVVAAHDISFSISPAECVALVGESGSGKTTIARTIVGLHPPAAGTITLKGQALAARAKDRPRELRRLCQIVFQNPYESLNPRHRVGDEIARPARVLRRLDRGAARAEVGRLLELVRLPASMANRFPGELSGGERQRVAIARALAAEPEVLICDEVTSSLDVSVQAAVIDLLNDLRLTMGMGLLFITHDLGVVASVADQVLVLEHGHLREQGSTERVLYSPEHGYTRELIVSAPRLARGEKPANRIGT